MAPSEQPQMVAVPAERAWGTTGVFVRAGLWLGVLALAIWFITRIQWTLGVFSLAWLIAYLLNPVVEFLENRRFGPIRRCSRGLAIGICYIFLAGLATLAGSLLVPALTGQVNRLMSLHQQVYDNPQVLSSAIQRTGERLARLVPPRYHDQILSRLNNSLESITTWVGSLVATGVSHLADFFGQVLAGTVIFLSGLLVSIYMLIGWKSLGPGVVTLFPPRYQGEAVGLLRQMNRIFGGYLRATILTSVAVSITCAIVLTLYSLISGAPVPYAYVISLIAGLTYPIPLFGILSSTVIATVLAFVGDYNVHVALWVGGLVFVTNNFIDRTVQPKLMSDAIGVSPLFVIFAAAAGGEFLGGVWGMLLGIPLAAMVKALFVWFHAHFLTDPTNPPRRRKSDHQPQIVPPGDLPPLQAFPEPEPESKDPFDTLESGSSSLDTTDGIE